MKLLKCSDRNEIFELKDNTKHWVEDWDTFLYYANKLKVPYYELLDSVNIIPFDELKSYKVGDTRKVKMIKEIIKGKDPDELFYPEPEVNAWHPNSKGIFTLSTGIPSVADFNYMKVDLVIPYKTLESPLVNFSNNGGEIIFMKNARDEEKYNVAGYLVEDEPENRPSSQPLPILWDRYNTLRSKTNKPVGCVFMAITMNPDDSNYTIYRELINAMDFLILTYYPWDDRNSDLSDSAILVRLEEIYNWVKNCGKPVMIAGQATYGSEHLLEPKIKMQSDYWRGNGYSMSWYVWNGQGMGIQAKFKDEIKNNG